MFYDSNNKYNAGHMFSLIKRKDEMIHFKRNHPVLIRKIGLASVFGKYAYNKTMLEILGRKNNYYPFIIPFYNCTGLLCIITFFLNYYCNNLC